MTTDEDTPDADGPVLDPESTPTSDDPDQVSFLGAPSAPPAATATAAASAPPANRSYQVLARKYRPQTFTDMIGQEVLVRTLTNAFAADRVAPAFIFTGVRGTGKTTTARIVAKCLNCVGPDGTGGPTIAPCGVCENCRAIAEDRHLDVVEMDAASRTGVDDIREILDGVRYRPMTARNKVYIIDEVHMLSRNAFNALLKTLEEPPDNVTFIFATTEIRKVPITVLSRCQRFDLRRIPADVLAEYLAKLAAAEGATVSDEALRLLARAADGSARDGLSLLDQAIAHGGPGGGGDTDEHRVRAMIGLADAGLVYDIFDDLMAANPASALGHLRDMYDAGADPIVVVQDLLHLTHWLTRVLVVPSAADDATATQLERTRGVEIARRLSVPVLSRTWQVLMKGLAEVQVAPSALQAAEMVLIRLAHMADMPPPADLIRRIQGAGQAPAASTAGSATPTAPPAPSPSGTAQAAVAVAEPAPVTAPATPSAPETPARQSAVAEDPATFAALVAMFGRKREGQVYNHLYRNARLVAYRPGRLDISLDPAAPPDLPGTVLRHLRDWLGQHWQVSVTDSPAADATLAEQDEAARQTGLSRAAADATVQAVLSAFPGATIARVSAIADVDTDQTALLGDPEDDDPVELEAHRPESDQPQKGDTR